MFKQKPRVQISIFCLDFQRLQEINASNWAPWQPTKIIRFSSDIYFSYVLTYTTCRRGDSKFIQRENIFNFP